MLYLLSLLDLFKSSTESRGFLFLNGADVTEYHLSVKEKY